MPAAARAELDRLDGELRRTYGENAAGGPRPGDARHAIERRRAVERARGEVHASFAREDLDVLRRRGVRRDPHLAVRGAADQRALGVDDELLGAAVGERHFEAQPDLRLLRRGRGAHLIAPVSLSSIIADGTAMSRSPTPMSIIVGKTI